MINKFITIELHINRSFSIAIDIFLPAILLSSEE